MPEPEKMFMVEDAQLLFLNFAGATDKYNPNGNRSFAVVLDEDTAQAMAADNWNVKYLEPRDEGDSPTPYIQVGVSYKFKPPQIVILANDGKSRTTLDERSVDVVDSLDIKLVDLICRGYDWEVGDKTGTKAYLKRMFITINEDPLERKYRMQQEASED